MMLDEMNTTFTQASLQRAGKEFRTNSSRFFFVKTIGWFVYLRGDITFNQGLISQDGIAGPFQNLQIAGEFVDHHIVKGI